MSTILTPAPPTLRSFWHDLPREGRLLLSIVAIEFIGTGLVLPFAVVYLHQVRGFSLGTSGALLAIPPLLGFAIVGPGGALIDRIGARRVLLATLLLVMAGEAVLSMASHVWIAALGLVLAGLGQGLAWPSSQTLVASVIPDGQRQRYFGVNFTLLNLGIGIGGIVGGVFVDVHHLWTFQSIYLADAVSYVPAFVLLLVPLRHVAGRPEHHPDVPKASYREVLRRPAVPTLLLLTFCSAFVGYAQLNTGMPAFATSVGRVSTHVLGFAFAFNTAVIVVLQLLVLQRIEGRRRTRVIAVMGAVWALSWLCLGVSGMLPGRVLAAVLVCAMASIFAFGETLLQPTVPAIVNDLADDRVRGRFNALNSASFQLPSMIAPPIAGALIGSGNGWLYIGILVVGCGVLGWLAIVRLEPQLSARVNGVR